jgi:hypothetical protein
MGNLSNIPNVPLPEFQKFFGTEACVKEIGSGLDGMIKGEKQNLTLLLRLDYQRA